MRYLKSGAVAVIGVFLSFFVLFLSIRMVSVEDRGFFQFYTSLSMIWAVFAGMGYAFKSAQSAHVNKIIPSDSFVFFSAGVATFLISIVAACFYSVSYFLTYFACSTFIYTYCIEKCKTPLSNKWVDYSLLAIPLLNIFGILVIYKFDWVSLDGLFVVYGSSNMVYVLFLLCFKRVLNWEFNVKGSIDIIKDSRFYWASSTFASAVNNQDKILVGFFFGGYDLGIYSAYVAIGLVINKVFDRISAARYVELLEGHNKKRVFSTKLLLPLAPVVTLASFIAGSVSFDLIFPREYGLKVFEFSLICTSCYLSSVAWFNLQDKIASGKDKSVLLFHIASALVLLASVSFFNIANHKDGVEAIAISLCITSLFKIAFSYNKG